MFVVNETFNHFSPMIGKYKEVFGLILLFKLKVHIFKEKPTEKFFEEPFLWGGAFFMP